ncbi:hypothetical protein GQ457_08G006190 [Hibiscus cannabinus]
MEPPFPSLFILFATSLLLSALVIIVKSMRSTDSNMKLPPGPWKLPIIGNLHQLVRFGSQPHQILRDLANQHGPLMHLQLGELSTIVVSSAEVAKDVMITHGLAFANRPYVAALDILTYGYRDVAMAPYGNYWRQIVSSVAFGNICKDHESYSLVVKELVKLGSGFRLADMYPSFRMLELISGLRQKAEVLLQKSDRIFQGIIDEHRAGLKRGITSEGEAKEDLVTVLLKIQQQGGLEFPLTDKDIKGIIWDIFGGGGETSSTTVDWAMSEMVRNPRVLKKAQNEIRQICHGKGDVDEASIKEIKYLALVIKETLRLHPPFPLLLPRESREDCEVNGYQVPYKAKIIINAWAIGRDPKYWNEPETFYPERFLDSSIDFKGTDLEYIPFGAGRRMCPGIAFALPNVELPLAKLLYHFDWELPSGMSHQNLDMTELFGVTMRRKDDLILIPTPYIC